MAQHIFSGIIPPATAPTAIGHHYIDTVSGISYIATGTTSSADWKATSSGSTGDVYGPANALNNAIPLFDGITGKLLKDSTETLSFVKDRANHTGTILSSVVSDFSSAADTRITAQKGVASGLATLDGTAKIPISQLPTSVTSGVVFQGTWDASSNSPALASSVGSKGHYYIVNTPGSTALDGISDWKINDWAIFNGSQWNKVDNTDSVTSVAGRTGAVVLTSADVGLANVDNTSDASKPVSTLQAASIATKLSISNNLSDLSSASTARTNLGLGSAAVSNTGDFVPASHVGSGGSQHAQASTSIDGFMSAADKTKLDGISTGANAGITALTGEGTATGPGSSALTLSNAAVIAKVLTGFGVDWNLVTSADTLLSAIQKLAGLSAMSLNQISGNVTIPTGYTWLRQNRTLLSGSAKITIQSGGKLTILS